MSFASHVTDLNQNNNIKNDSSTMLFHGTQLKRFEKNTKKSQERVNLYKCFSEKSLVMQPKMCKIFCSTITPLARFYSLQHLILFCIRSVDYALLRSNSWNGFPVAGNISRSISNTELSSVLRPFYFAVHPDLFGRHPEQRVSAAENGDLKVLFKRCLNLHISTYLCSQRMKNHWSI